MHLDDLHLALVIGREGSLTAASARLGIAPGTLSKALARLERAAKVKLFERMARGMRPTEVGAAFLARAARIDLAAADLHAELRDLRQARSGVLRIGIGQGIADRWIQPAIVAIVERGVSVELSGGMTDSLRRDVVLGELDFAVFGLFAPPGEGLAWQVLLDDPMQSMAPKGHPLTRAAPRVTWRELAAARWLMTGRSTSTWSEFDANFKAHGVPAPLPAVISRSSNRERLLTLALNAVVLMPRSVIDDPEVRAKLAPIVPVGGWRSRRRLGIAYRDDAYLSPAARFTMDRIAQSIRAAA